MSLKIAKSEVLELADRELDEAIAENVMAQQGHEPIYSRTKTLSAPAFSADANATRQMEEQMGNLKLGYEYSEELLGLVGYIHSSEESAAAGVWLGSQATLQQKCHAALLVVLNCVEYN